jgi:hypothetical protein
MSSILFQLILRPRKRYLQKGHDVMSSAGLFIHSMASEPHAARRIPESLPEGHDPLQRDGSHRPWSHVSVADRAEVGGAILQRGFFVRPSMRRSPRED